MHFSNTYGYAACRILSFLMMCTFQNTAIRCKPKLSEGSHSNLVRGGHVSLECGIVSCRNVSQIIYERKRVHNNTKWSPVFKGINKTNYDAIDADNNEYYVKSRYDYTAFYSQHILYIKPLILEDEGKWRCAAYNMDKRIAESKPVDLVLSSQCKPEISDESKSEHIVGGQATLACDTSTCVNVSRITYEKTGIHFPVQWTPVYEGTNKLDNAALNTGTEYSLTYRTKYEAVDSHHVLHIKSLMLEDQGEWICAVHYLNKRIAESHALDFYMGDEIKISNASQCKPEISEGFHNKLNVGGYSVFECDISDCQSVTKVAFEKNGIHHPLQWTQVYEGNNKTNHHSSDTFTNYSLAMRTEYTTFYSRHLLYINPLIPEDEGEWRCVVYDLGYKSWNSEPIAFFLETSERQTQETSTRTSSNSSEFSQNQSYDHLEIALITYSAIGGILIITYFILLGVASRLGFVHCSRCRRQKLKHRKRYSRFKEA